MLTARSNESLYRKIVHRYFGFGLICIGVVPIAAASGELFPQEKPVWFSAAAIAAGLTALWLGGMQIRRLLTAPEQILSQLAALAGQDRVDSRSLVPVTEAEPAAAGWNQLLHHLRSGGLSEGLEAKLAAALQSGSDARMGDVLNTISDGIAVTDAQGIFHTNNHAARALLQADEQKPLNELNILQLLKALAGSRQGDPVPETAERCRFELQKSDDLSDGVLRVSCRSLLTDDAGAESFVWTVRDITQQKLAERMRTEFVETATHELRTPLANIRAYAETLQLTDDIPVEQQKEFINIINSESTRLGRFVDELLNLSRMDAGSVSVSRHETDFERMLQECIDHTRPQMEQKQQTFETQIPAKLPHLNVDKDKMASCLVNLLGNACKYTPESGTIRLVVEESPTELKVRVEDTGYGISEEELPRVFNRFFRSSDERVLNESGSGLGLAYTQEIARLHGGRLTVDSELNQGSQFTLHLPL